MIAGTTDLRKLERASEMLKAIAHPIRISMVSMLTDGSRMSVTEIHEQLDIGQSAASHHLGILKSKGVVEAERDGKNCYYQLTNTRLGQILTCIEQCSSEN